MAYERRPEAESNSRPTGASSMSAARMSKSQASSRVRSSLPMLRMSS